MISNAQTVQRVVLYEGLGSHPLENSRRHRLIQGLLEKGFSVARVLPDDRLAPLGHRQLIVLGEFQPGRPLDLETHADGVEIHVRDITALDEAQCLEAVQVLSREAGGGTAGGWKPWFPVIDYQRCTNCMQCLSFCLFDVYGVTSDGKIQVQNENNCKTDCPACSRVCPEVAILFPKYKAGPINGDEVNAEDVRREAMKVDISALLGGDIYSLLRDRSAKAKSRFSKERDDERALKERQRCLEKLRDGAAIEIPPEVLASLPSLDQIQEKAVLAKQRAQEAIAFNQARLESSGSQPEG